MKNLKKSLALVLAIALVFSLVVFANAEFTDADQINPKFADAVGIMNGLGIISGYDTGAFGPQDTLTRGQAMKIITYLKLGKKAADMLKTTVAPFDDVPTTAWEAPFVAYCKNQKITAGYGDGNFGKDDKLSGFAFAKFLLVALGYGTQGEFEGDEWQVAVAIKATEVDINLFNGIEDYLTDDPLPREVAAQAALNATQIQPVKYNESTKDYVESGKPFCESPLAFNPEAVITTDADGRPMQAYYKMDQMEWEDHPMPFDPQYPGLYVLKLGAKPFYTTTAEAIYTTTAGWDAAIAANKNFVISGADYYLNTAVSTQGAIQALGAGITLEFYGRPGADGKVNINTVVATDYSFDTVAAVTETKVTLDGAGDITDAANVKLLKDFAKDDALAIVWNGSKIVSAVKAEPITGEKVTAVSTGSATIDGTKYVVDKSCPAITVGAISGTYYAAPNGALIGFVGESVVVPAVYVYAVKVFSKTSGGGLDEYGDPIPSSTAWYVQTVSEDGEAVNYQVKTNHINDNGTPSDDTDDFEDYELPSGKGVYKLETKFDATLKATVAEFKSENVKKEATATIAATAKKTPLGTYFDSAMKFIFVKGDGSTIQIVVKDGVQAISSKDIYYHTTAVTGGVKTAVIFVDGAPAAGEATPVGIAYTFGDTASSSTALVTNAKGEEVPAYVKSVYVDGVKKDIYYAGAGPLADDTFWKVTEDGQLAVLTEVSPLPSTLIKKTAVTGNIMGMLSVAGHEDMATEGVAFVNMTTDNTLTDASKLTNSNYVALQLNSDGGLVAIYVVG